jgi:glycosyltransferase involved in cell wall biosynthesis
VRVVIDLQGAQNGSRYRGIGRYTLSFAKAFLRHREANEIILLASGLFPDEIGDLRQFFASELQAVELRVFGAVKPASYISKSNFWRRKTSQLLREAYIESLEPDVLIVSSMIEGAGDDVVSSVGECSSVFTVAILYDLIPLIYEKEYLADATVADWYFEKLQNLKRADAWFAISESSRSEGMRLLGLPADRIVNISAAVGPEFRKVGQGDPQAHESPLRNLNITRPYLLYAGATDPRKNLERLLSAYASLPEATRAEHQLVFAGGMPRDHLSQLKAIARAEGLGQHEVVFTDRISDDQLIVLYCSCKAFILPSLHEGFGLPALEAMSCGAPTIGSNAASIPEVIGFPEALFDPTSTIDMANKINRVLTEGQFRRDLIAHGMMQAAEFSWDRTATRAWMMLEELAQRGKIADRVPFDPESCAAEIIRKISNYGPSEEQDLMRCSTSIARLFPRNDPRPTLFIDVSELHRRDTGTGIQRVVRNVARHLLAAGLESHRLEFVSATEEMNYRTVSGGAWASTEVPQASEATSGPIDARDGDIFLGLDFHDVIVARRAGFYDDLRACGVKVYFVVYDLLPITHPEYFSSAVVHNFRNWLQVVSRQTGAICISRSVAGELDHWMVQHVPRHARRFDISWFHLGADFHHSPEAPASKQEVRVLRGLTASTTFLCVGTLEPRKRQAQVLDAFELLWAKGFQSNLVFVGKEGWMIGDLPSRLLNHPELGRRLLWLNGIDDGSLGEVYAASTCLIAASDGEGFGLPLVEAAQWGLPIIARDIGVFREVARDNAYYFKGIEPESLAGAIEEWTRLHESGRHATSAGLAWKTWEESTADLMNVLLGHGKDRRMPDSRNCSRRAALDEKQR